jgi:hypothetical protein
VDHEVLFPLSEAPLFPPTSAMPTLADLTSSSSDYVLPVTLHDTPRLFLQKWLVAVNAYARTLEPSLDQYGALYLVCTDEVWADLTKNQVHPVHNIGPIAIRPRPDHPTPPNRPSIPRLGLGSIILVSAPCLTRRTARRQISFEFYWQALVTTNACF